MTPHLEASKGAYAEAVLLPGDPLRAKWIAETFFDDPQQVNGVRSAFGYTGQYKGVPVSVQATGMGMPSCSIYCHELLDVYDVKKLIRVGTCGAIQEDVAVREIILGLSAATDSQMNQQRFNGMDYAPGADFGLLSAAHEAAQQAGVDVRVGTIFSSDVFYSDLGLAYYEKMRAYGVLAVEMEANAIYTLAAKFKASALAICSVSDNIVTGAGLPPIERQQSLHDMVSLALETAIAA